MKKKTILLFLSFLVICGTVNVDAQVRIGGGSAPHLSSILDLNPDNTAFATGGLALPRVRLDSVKHTGVFDAGITLMEGLLVYNLNDGDKNRPEKGVYYYNGQEWVFLGGGGYRYFTISSAPQAVWLGRDGELTGSVDITLSPNPAVDKLPVTYELEARYGDVKIKLGTDPANLTFKDGMLPGKVYTVYCKASLYDYTVEGLVGYLVYGIGGWTGPGKWLRIANVNAGGNQDLSLDDQFAMNVRTTYYKSLVGGYFQWGRVADGHEGLENGNLQYGTGQGPITDMINAIDYNTGTPKGEFAGKFITQANEYGDWRSYPPEMPDAVKFWNWRKAEEPNVGLDPCGMSNDGNWYVMTVEQWNLLREYNHIQAINTGTSLGIGIYPAGQEQPASIYFPHYGYRSANGKLIQAPGSSIWFNNVGGTSDMAQYLRLEGDDAVLSASGKVLGHPIRCVSE